MSRFHRIAEETVRIEGLQRTPFDERFLADLIPDNPLSRVEGQELRQVFMKALEELSPEELKVVELRFQHKRSQGQVASRLRMDREVVADLEKSGIEKLRRPIVEYMES